MHTKNRPPRNFGTRTPMFRAVCVAEYPIIISVEALMNWDLNK